MIDPKFKLTIHPAVEGWAGGMMVLDFNTKEEMVAASESCASLLLFIQGGNLMKDYSNMFIQEELIDDEWYEIDEVDAWLDKFWPEAE